MEILILSRFLFDRFLAGKKVTPENVEQQNKVFFISITNPDDKNPPYFPEDKENVKVISFPDTDRDIAVPIINPNPSESDVAEIVEMKAFNIHQARELFQFIKKHKDKELCVLHCTAGVSRSGAVGTFINDYVGGNWNELMRKNPSIIPNTHVYKLLHDAWYEDHSHKDSFTGNPLTWQRIDEAGQMPVVEYPKRGYDKGDTSVVGISIFHHDGTKTYVAGVDPYETFEQFWLETDKFYSMIDREDIEILRHAHPDFGEIFLTRRKIAPKGEFELFPSFGFGPEYTGGTLVEWLTEKNMLVHFK